MSSAIRSLAALLERSASRHAGRDAVVIEGSRVSWSDLAGSARRLARSFASHGVDPGDRVGLWLPKSHAALAGLWGTLECGAAYVPIDPGAPPARLAMLARDAGVRALVTSPDRAATAADALAGADSLRAIWVSGATPGAAPAGAAPFVPWAEVEAESDAPLGRAPGPADLAYILYTSGSTGVPKGVVHSHASALAFAVWAAETFSVTHEDRVSNHAPFHFDLSTFDLFSSAFAGAAVYPVPPRATLFPSAIAKLYAAERLTIWYETPSALALLLRHGRLGEQDLSALRVLLFAGEVMPVPLLRELMALAPGARFANLYGPTETNVCTWFDVVSPPDGAQALPIGVPSCGDRAWVLDEAQRPVAPGEVGELWISGPTLMRGYWGDAERTGQSIRELEPEAEKVRAYRTGDLTRWSEGQLHFHGRRDHQIKTRGYRVELGEIESALHAHPAVAEAVVIGVPDEEVGHRLRAVVVLRAAGGEGAPGTDTSAMRPGVAELKDHCARRLPRYMVPEFLDLRDTLPRTPSGKVDRTLLAAEDGTSRKDPA